MTTIVEFLSQRWDEIERIAQAIDDKQADSGWGIGEGPGFTPPPGHTITPHIGRVHEIEAAQHIVMHGPDYVLADIAAKRAILNEHEPIDVVSIDEATYRQVILACLRCRMGERQIVHPCPTLRQLALPFAQHPDYDETWRPT